MISTGGACPQPVPQLPSREPLQRLWRAVSGALASVFFPDDCRLCKRLLTNASRLPICEKCLTSFTVIDRPICPLRGQPETGAPANPEVNSLCVACQEHTYRFHVARSFGIYEGALARAIVMLKFEGIEPLGGGLHGNWKTWCSRTPNARRPTSLSPSLSTGTGRKSAATTSWNCSHAPLSAIGNSLPAGFVDAHTSTSGEAFTGL